MRVLVDRVSIPSTGRSREVEPRPGSLERAALNGRRAPEKVMLDPMRYGNPTKAANAETYMLSKMTFQESPNLWVGSAINNARTKITLQHDRVSVDNAAAAERLLELLAPLLEQFRRELELLDHRRFFPAAACSLHSHHSTSWIRFSDL